MQNLETLLQRAQAGDAAAQYALGNAYHLGMGGLPRQLLVAMRWYLKAATQGHVDAQVNLGVIFIHEITSAGGSRNPEQARYWFKRAAELGDAQAMVYLARIYLDGDGTAAAPEKACRWLERAGEAGHVDAYNQLGLLFAGSRVGTPDPQRAALAFERGARLGDQRAQLNLGNCYLTGHGVEQDHARAAEWYRAAADQGLGEAQYNLALLLLSGAEGVAADAAQGVRWLVTAADTGFAPAQFDLAKRLRTGDLLPADTLQSLHYYHEAADQGHPEAMFSLALMLEVGAGLDRAYPEQAARWYRRLAQEQAHGGAAHNLGILHAQGSGVPKNVRAAVALFEYAISLGADEAMASLALVFIRGDGLAQDLPRAARWAILSRQHDPKGDGQKLLDPVASLLPPPLIEQAHAEARAWVREPKTMRWEVLDDALEAAEARREVRGARYEGRDAKLEE